MKRHFNFFTITALVISTGLCHAEQPSRQYKVMLTASPFVGSPNPLFKSPCEWPTLLSKIDGYKYCGRQFMDPMERRLDAKTFAQFTNKSKLVVGIEFGHMFLPPEGSTQEPWQRWLNEAVAEIQPVFDAGGRVDTVHVDGPIRRLLGFGGGGGVKQRSLPYDQAMDQFVKFWVELEKRYKGIRIGYLVNFPNWDYTKEYHGLIGHFTDKTGNYFDDVLSEFYRKLTVAGGTLSFLEVDCPYKYYVAEKTHRGDAPVDNPGKIRALERWCDARNIKLHMIVNEQALSHKVQDPAPELVAEATKRFTENSVSYVQALATDGITPDTFLIQSWYGVPKIHVPETKTGTTTHAASAIVTKIHQCYGQESNGLPEQGAPADANKPRR
jgi:hypothetical protein